MYGKGQTASIGVEEATISRARVLHVGSRIGSIAWSSDARLIAIQTATTDAEKRRRWTIQLHDAQSGKLQNTLTDTAEERLRIATKTQEPKFSVRFSPDSKFVACAAWAETRPIDCSRTTS